MEGHSSHCTSNIYIHEHNYGYLLVVDAAITSKEIHVYLYLNKNLGHCLT